VNHTSCATHLSSRMEIRDRLDMYVVECKQGSCQLARAIMSTAMDEVPAECRTRDEVAVRTSQIAADLSYINYMKLSEGTSRARGPRLPSLPFAFPASFQLQFASPRPITLSDMPASSLLCRLMPPRLRVCHSFSRIHPDRSRSAPLIVPARASSEPRWH
jgi:hypothetical protein